MGPIPVKLLLVNNDKGWGGGQEHLKGLASELLKQGVDVHFVVRAGSQSEIRFKEMVESVYAMPRHGLGTLKAFWQLAAILRRERFDIVSVNREHDLFITALALRLAFPVHKQGKLTMSYHTATSRRQLFLGSADAVVCISQYVRDTLLSKNKIDTSRVTILYNGIPSSGGVSSEKFNPHRKRLLFDKAGFPLIGMVGAFFKNQIELIDAIPFIGKEFPGLTVALVGDDADPGLTGHLLGKIREIGVEDKVVLTGKIPQERMADAFYDFDLSVSTFRNEGFGLVHLESLAAGTPVVTYNAGGQVDIFHGENVGVLVDGGPEEFAAAVLDLLRDDEKRFAMGRRGCGLVKQKYSLRSMGERYMHFYRDLLQSGQPPITTPPFNRA